MMVKSKTVFGFTLIETLAALSIFAIIGILSTRAIILSLSGSKKGSSSITVRENLNYSLDVIDRLLRNANEISACSSTVVSYRDESGTLASISCVDPGSDGYIASGSARLTSTEIAVTSCTISCDLSSVPPSVSIDVTANDVGTFLTKEDTQISVYSTILLRTY